MRYIGQTEFRHIREAKIGILLTNLGTPAAPTRPALRKYLKQFLSDPRVVELPRALWWLILNGIILNTRPAKSARLYQSIWTERGSPLLLHTQDQADAVRSRLNARVDLPHNQQLMVRYAMRYGEPSIESVLQSMQAEGVEKIVVMPLYPQYAGSTTGSAFDAISRQLTKTRWVPDFRFISHYHDNPLYVSACARRITEYWNKHGRGDKLLFSFHGLPQFHLEKGDPYFCQCHKTARLLTQELGLDKADVVVSFQSRFGRAEWLKPYTDQTLVQLADQGVKKLDVFCPGFAADCLETLEEIAVENKQVFLNAGGDKYQYIPALNSEPSHIEALCSILLKGIDDWLTCPQRDTELADRLYQSVQQKPEH